MFEYKKYVGLVAGYSDRPMEILVVGPREKLVRMISRCTHSDNANPVYAEPGDYIAVCEKYDGGKLISKEITQVVKDRLSGGLSNPVFTKYSLDEDPGILQELKLETGDVLKLKYTTNHYEDGVVYRHIYEYIPPVYDWNTDTGNKDIIYTDDDIVTITNECELPYAVLRTGKYLVRSELGEYVVQVVAPLVLKN